MLSKLFKQFGKNVDSSTGHQLHSDLAELMLQGDEARLHHNYEAAEQAYQRGLALAKQRHDTSSEETFLGQLGALATEQGQFDQAHTYFAQAVTLARTSYDTRRQARTTLNMGVFHLLRKQAGDAEMAQTLLQEALSLGRQAYDSISAGLAASNLAELYTLQNNPAYAMRVLREIPAQFTQNPRFTSGVLGRLGEAHLALGEIDKGRQSLVRALTFAEQNQQPDYQVLWLAALAKQAMCDGKYGEVLSLYSSLDALLANAALGPLPPDLLYQKALNQATALHTTKQYAQAHAAIQQALTEAKTDADRAQALFVQGNLYHAEQEHGQAQRTFEQALQLFDTTLASNAAGDKANDLVQARRSNTLLALAQSYHQQGDEAKSQQILDLALSQADEDDLFGQAQTRNRLGMLLFKQGNLTGALNYWTTAVKQYEAVNALPQLARLLCDVAGVRRILSGIRTALDDYERATMLLSGIKDIGVRGHILSMMAMVYTDLGEKDTAKSFYQEAIHLARQQANRRAESLRMGNYGWFHIMTGQPAEGLRLLDEALSISRTLADDLLIAVQTSNRGLALHDLKQYEQANQCFEDALQRAGQLPERRWEAMFRSNRGRTWLAQGRTEDAIPELEQALSLGRGENDQETLSRTLIRLADVYMRQGRLDDADALAREGETVARRWGYRKGHADALVVRAGIADGQHNREQATQFLQEAHKLYVIMGDPAAHSLAHVLEQ